MAKSINVLLAVKDQFTAPLRNATRNTQTLDRELKKASNRIKAFGNNMKKGFMTAGKYAAIGLTAATAATSVFLKSSIDAAKVQIEQETKLAAVLKNTKGIRDKDIESIKQYAGALQNQGVIGDEVALAGVQQMGTYQLQAETIKKLMPGMNDLLAQTKGLNATTGDAVTVGNLIGKVMTGQVGALKKVGINFNTAQERVLKFGTEQEKAAMLAKVLKSNVGGVNKALAETDQGRVQQMTNAWGDMKEEVGKKLLPYMGQFSKWFITKIPLIQAKIFALIENVTNAIKTVIPYIIKIKEALAKVFEQLKPGINSFKVIFTKTFNVAINTVRFFIKNFDRISPIIYSVVGAMVAYKTVMVAIKVATVAGMLAIKAKTAFEIIAASKTGILTAAQWALNAAMAANPIGLVITAIAGLVGGIWLLYKNWDICKAKMLQFWEYLKGLWATLDNNPLGRATKVFLKFMNPVGQLITLFKFLKSAIYDNWELIKEKLLPVLETIKNPIKSAKNAISGWFSWGKDEEENKTTPRHALGTSYWRGGMTGINEGGRAETAILPSGTRILSHEASKNSKATSINISLNIQGNVIGNKQFLEETGNYLTQKIILALNNC